MRLSPRLAKQTKEPETVKAEETETVEVHSAAEPVEADETPEEVEEEEELAEEGDEVPTDTAEEDEIPETPAAAPAHVKKATNNNKAEEIKKARGKFALKKKEEKVKEEADEARSKRMGRTKMVESFKNFLGDNIEGMENLTNESAKMFLEAIEGWFNELVTQYSLNFGGFYFGHYQKLPCFREPNGIISYISAHEEIRASRALNVIKKVCMIDKDGKFVAGERGKDSEGNVIVIPNKADTEAIYPLYKEHLQRVVSQLDKDEEKSKRRKEKNLSRAGSIL